MQNPTSGAFEVILQQQSQTSKTRFEIISNRVSESVRFRLFRPADLALRESLPDNLNA